MSAGSRHDGSRSDQPLAACLLAELPGNPRWRLLDRMRVTCRSSTVHPAKCPAIPIASAQTLVEVDPEALVNRAGSICMRRRANTAGPRRAAHTAATRRRYALSTLMIVRSLAWPIYAQAQRTLTR